MLDGIVLHAISQDLKQTVGGRIDKIYQPNKDEIVFNIRAGGKNQRLLLSANASAPRIHFTQEKFDNPQNPPMFCMLLRKHITGKIIDIRQPEFERILEIHIESMSELGDLSVKRLIIEIMGKHSNIILINDKNIIIDSIKHVNKFVSSIREVMPGRPYEVPPSQGKLSFLTFSADHFFALDRTEAKLLHTHYTGIAPKITAELLSRSGIEAHTPPTDAALERLFETTLALQEAVTEGSFRPYVAIDHQKLIDFHVIPIHAYTGCEIKYFDTLSQTIEYFYTQREQTYRTTQKTADLRKVIQNNINRCVKKHNMFLAHLKEIADKEQLKLYGELITANIHTLTQGESTFTTQNFYDEDLTEITITLDPQLTPVENAQKYFKQYNKHKRSHVATLEQMDENTKELNYLEGIQTALSVELTEEEIEEIRFELAEENILKKRKVSTKNNKATKHSAPFKFTSSDGFVILVGKNNKQNEDITTHAHPNDLWFHAKDIPGSHVIVKTEGRELTAIPDTTLEEAAGLAAYYSKGQDASSVSVDYALKKYVRKPKGAKPGMVIYDHFKTAYVAPNKNIHGKD